MTRIKVLPTNISLVWQMRSSCSDSNVVKNRFSNRGSLNSVHMVFMGLPSEQAGHVGWSGKALEADSEG